MVNKENSDSRLKLPSAPLWEKNEHNIWLVSTVKLFRNVEKFSFPGKLKLEDKKQLLALLNESLGGSKGLQNPRMLKAEDLSALDKEYLLEHFFSVQSFHPAQAGEAFVVDDTGTFLACLNIRDHLQLRVTTSSGDLEEACNRLVNIETPLGSTLGFAYNPQFGFLTADPQQCGTALFAFIFLQVPALIHTGALPALLQTYCKDSVIVTGMQGDPENFVGDVIVLRNAQSLGLTEENIVSTLRSVITKLMVEEKSTRTKVGHNHHPHIRDLVSRAFGLLRHSYQLEAVEALNAISLVKLGLGLGWIKGLTVTDLNGLFVHCRRAHLVGKEQDMHPEEILHHRAEVTRAALANAALDV